jgi:3-hydroxyisobutyrate dehydrogenase
MAKVAFLGLGLMGQGMAKNLLQAGHEVTVWNRSSHKALPFVEAGAVLASEPFKAVEHADLIISIVGDDKASHDVWLSDNGILAGNLKNEAIAVECTTVSRKWMETLGARCIDAGLRFLDCPVTGGPPGADSGQLTLLIGGAADTVVAAEPVLRAFAKRLYHFGDVGAGTAYKLIVNAIGAAHIAALAEATLVAEKAGLNLETFADALRNSSVASRVTNYNTPRMVSDIHDDVAFAAKWRAKDVDYSIDMARGLGCNTPLFDLVADIFQCTIENGFGDINESAILHTMKKGVR